MVPLAAVGANHVVALHVDDVHAQFQSTRSRGSPVQACLDEFVICVVDELEREEGLLGVGNELEKRLVALPMR